MKREDVVKDRRVCLTIPRYLADRDLKPMPTGTKGTIHKLEQSDYEHIEDYVMVRFDGRSYFSCVPISSLTIE